MERQPTINIDKLIKIYELHLGDIRSYNTLIWQFPMALITVNLLAVNFFLNKPRLLVIMPLINFVLLHALFKQVHTQRAIIKATENTLSYLKECLGEQSNIIGNFQKKGILRIRSASLLSYSFLSLNIIFFSFALYKLF